MSIFVYCLAHDEPTAENIVQALLQGGFHAGDISVLIPEQVAVRGSTTAKKITEKASRGVPAWVAGIRHLDIFGLGSFNATGPIRASAANGLIATLMDLGMPGYEAKRYDGKVRQGSILVSVHPADRPHAFKAKDIFVQMGASDVGCTDEGRTNAGKAKTEPILRALGRAPLSAISRQRHRLLGY